MTAPAGTLALGGWDWLHLFGHYLLLSLLSVGGALTTAPEMHRYLVLQHRWLTDSQFSSSITLAQVAPGPNILFVALLGWNLGMNSGGLLLALAGAFIALAGILLPSTLVTYLASQWSHRNRHLRAVRAFKQGMAPVAIGLMLATGWILAGSQGDTGGNGRLWCLTAAAAVLVWRTQLHLLWFLAAGALLGILGWV
ncbi:chromate transporter [Geothrix sp. 21YS21S-4]|uniref:chromate transporter n=1 Tax=Geothrix sp. 21YS21S-4 TaxID=3068889 RepID=UPI0027BA4A9E|nr:chromate transporter [Geothrix sp. 21YS21S-4]